MVVSSSVTKTRTEQLVNGDVLTVEQKQIDTQTLEVEHRVTIDTQEEYQAAVLASEKDILTRSVRQVINTNPYLKWRILDTLETSNQLNQRTRGFSQWTDTPSLFRACYNQLQGIGFLARFPWCVCWEYGELAFVEAQRCQDAVEKSLTAKLATDPKWQSVLDTTRDSRVTHGDFMNEFIVACFIDKLLVNAYYGNDPLRTASTPWPVCVSGIPEVTTVHWGQGTVKVASQVEFLFPDAKDIPRQMHDWILRPAACYFPLDLMLLLPDYRKVYQTQLTEDRAEVLEYRDFDVGYQLYLAQKIQRLHDHQILK